MSVREAVNRRYVRAAEVCEYLGLASSTLYEYLKRGLIPHYPLGGRYRFILEEIEESMQKRRRGGN